MNEPKWTELKKDLKISATRADGGVWQLAVSFLEAPGFLKITADGEWTYSNVLALKCKADGDLLSPLNPKRCIHEASPVGCLIGRIWGSSASRATEGIFTVGSLCVLKLAADQQGPLFLTINDLWTGFADNGGEVTVQIQFAPATSS